MEVIITSTFMIMTRSLGLVVVSDPHIRHLSTLSLLLTAIAEIPRTTAVFHEDVVPVCKPFCFRDRRESTVVSTLKLHDTTSP